MKSFISLAIAVLMINVQGSPLNEVVENDYGPNDHRDYTSVDGRDAIIAGQIQEELQDTKALDRREHNETSVTCVASFCQICQDVYCLFLQYLSMDNKFIVAITYLHSELYQEIIEAKDWYKCMQLEILEKVSESCVLIENVRIKDRQACVDLKISSEFMKKSLSDLCM